MCGRFTLAKGDFAELAALVDATYDEALAASYKPRYNIAPTDQHWIVREKREQRQLLPAKWGLVNSWSPDMKGAARQINARSETAQSTRAFRDAFERRRCAVPADGFFEWTGAKEKRHPIWYHAPDNGLLLFAGLYESWQDPKSGDWTRSFTTLTTDANETVAPVHDRMPVVLPPERVDDWLHVPADDAEQDAEQLKAILRPAATEMLVATEVSARVNSVKNDDPECLVPWTGEGVAEAPRLL